MKELKTLVINGVSYAITDENKIPAPQQARVGDTIRVAAVDARGRPTAWETAAAPILESAVFDALDEDGEVFVCLSHTAAELIRLVNQGYTVIGILRNQSTETSRSFFCFTDGDSRIVVGDAFMDGGWQHCPGQQSFYNDGDAGNWEIGNELWIAY